MRASKPGTNRMASKGKGSRMTEQRWAKEMTPTRYLSSMTLQIEKGEFIWLARTCSKATTRSHTRICR